MISNSEGSTDGSKGSSLNDKVFFFVIEFFVIELIVIGIVHVYKKKNELNQALGLARTFDLRPPPTVPTCSNSHIAE